MAQIITTSAKAKDNVLYSPIASIKQYNEPDFEKKLLRYGSTIFMNFHVYSLKYSFTSDVVSGPYQPDLLLISKSLKKWVIVEVELCKTPSSHTINQIKCFSNPKYDANKLYDFLERQDGDLSAVKTDLIYLFSNVTPDFIVVMDDYSDEVFAKFRAAKKNLKICVLEVYKTTAHPFEAYRFGGDYPYEISNSSKLKWIDHQHYEIVKIDFAKVLPKNMSLKFHMENFDANILNSGRRYYLKLPEHNIPEDVYLQIGITTTDEYVLQRF